MLARHPDDTERSGAMAPRRRKPWLQKFNTACAAVADECVTLPTQDKAHAAGVAGCAGDATTFCHSKFM